MTKKLAYEPGQVIEVKNYPFSIATFHGFDIDDGPFVDDGWRPGCEIDTNDEGVRDYSADGLGAMLLEVVQVVSLPGNFAPRVFYIRQWRDPDGKVFGKRLCRVTTVSAFSKLLKGYRHEFYLDGELFHPRFYHEPAKNED